MMLSALRLTTVLTIASVARAQPPTPPTTLAAPVPGPVQTLRHQPWTVVVRAPGGLAVSGRLTDELPGQQKHSSVELPTGHAVDVFDNQQTHFTVMGRNEATVVTAERVYQDAHRMKTWAAYLRMPDPVPTAEQLYDLLRAYHSPEFGVCTLVVFVPGEADVKLAGESFPLFPPLATMTTRGQAAVTIKLGARTPIVLHCHKPIVESAIGMIHVDFGRDKDDGRGAPGE